MQSQSKRTNRTIVVDFQDEATYHSLCHNGRTFIEFVVAFIMSIGFQLKHKCDCPGGFRLTRHSHYMRVRLNGLVIWRIQCTHCRAVFTVLPHFVMRYRKMKPETAKQVLLATHGGLSLEYCAMLGILTDGFESTIKSMHSLFPEAAIGNCLLHAARRILSKLRSVPKTTRQTISHELYQIFEQCQEAKANNLRSLGQKLRRFCEKVTRTTGVANGETIRTWIRKKKAGWYTLFRDSQMPTTSTLLDQAHNAMDRKLFMMKGFHHENGSQNMFLNSLAILYNLIPYQRRAKNAGKCGVQVQGGKLPTDDWFCNRQILTSGGFQ